MWDRFLLTDRGYVYLAMLLHLFSESTGSYVPEFIADRY
jgi:hypothetical protein